CARPRRAGRNPGAASELFFPDEGEGAGLESGEDDERAVGMVRRGVIAHIRARTLHNGACALLCVEAWTAQWEDADRTACPPGAFAWRCRYFAAAAAALPSPAGAAPEPGGPDEPEPVPPP